MNFKYTLAAIASIPLLPIMYFQGRKIRANVPSLPEAPDLEGASNNQGRRKIKMLLIGESTLAGVGVISNHEGFSGTLANALASKFKINVDWKVYAKSGYSAKNVHDLIIPTISEQSADLIVIGLGGNDAFEFNTPGTWTKNVNQIITTLKKRFGNTAIVFTNMPPIKEFPAFTPMIKLTMGNLVELFGRELDKAVSSYDHVFYAKRVIKVQDWVDRLELNIQLNTEFFSDGVHPSKLTYQIWARDFADFIFEQQELRDFLNNKI